MEHLISFDQAGNTVFCACMLRDLGAEDPSILGYKKSAILYQAHQMYVSCLDFGETYAYLFNAADSFTEMANNSLSIVSHPLR